MSQRARALLIVLGLAASLCAAQQTHPLREGESKPIERPPVSEPVLKRLEAPYLTPEEGKDLRIFHGVPRESDLDTPTREAAWALIRGTYDDPAFADASVPPEDRAEAALRRGELDTSLDLVRALESPRAVRIRAEALELSGKLTEAADTAEPLAAKIGSGELTTAPEVLEGVRAMAILARIRPSQTSGGDFKSMMSALGKARESQGRLYWPIHLAEADILYEKDNSSQGGSAAQQALAMCPGSAAGWSLLGGIAVESFNFEGAEQVAEQLKDLDAASSPEAAVVLARAALRQNDPESAQEALTPALERFPRMRSLLALRAAATALTYDWTATDQKLAEFDALSPGSPLAYFEVGRALSEARQYDIAAKYLATAAERAPNWSHPWIELGLMRLQAGDDVGSRDALRKAAALDPFNIRAGNTLKLVEELANYAKVESEHFIVRYKPGDDAVLAGDMLLPLEEMHRRVAGNDPGGIDHEPARKTIIDLMPDQRWFAVRIAGVTRIHTMAASTGPCIAMETPREGPRHTVGTYDWLRVVRHEYTHTVSLSRTNNRIPHWFTEAAAVYLEDAPRAFNTCQLLQQALENDALFDLREINFAFVRPKKPTDRAQAYAQGHWMYEYIIERWGARAPLDLMDRYAQGERQEAAFRRVLGVGQDQFLDEFREWAAAQVAAWGMSDREGEPSLARILLLEAASSDGGRKGMEDKLAALANDAALALAGSKAPPQWSPDLPRPSVAMVNRWLEKHPDHAGLLASAVKFALDAADGNATEDSVPLLERYARARPVDPAPHQKLAHFYLSSEARDRAIPHLEYLDAREQNSPAYAAELAQQYARAGQWDKAAAKAERAAIIAPFSAQQRELAATVLLQARDYAGAIRHIEALTLLEPTREIHTQRLEAARRLAEQARSPQ